MEMRQIALVSIAVLVLMIGAPSVYAETEYQLGFKRGVSDARIPTVGMTPILKAAADEIDKHPHAYFQGWMDGFCSIDDNSSDADEFTFDCSRESSQDQLGSGFQHGVADGLLQKNIVCRSDGCDPVSLYILQPGQGFANQTHSFVEGYVKGYCSIKDLGGIDEDQASFDCQIGPASARPQSAL
jgi:hypothetical protein